MGGIGVGNFDFVLCEVILIYLQSDLSSHLLFRQTLET